MPPPGMMKRGGRVKKQDGGSLSATKGDSPFSSAGRKSPALPSAESLGVKPKVMDYVTKGIQDSPILRRKSGGKITAGGDTGLGRLQKAKAARAARS